MIEPGRAGIATEASRGNAARPVSDVRKRFYLTWILHAWRTLARRSSRSDR